jgi:hypothetical protein
MAVSQSFLDAGKNAARRHALKLVLRHAVPALNFWNGERQCEAARGLSYARMLGRQHGFEDQVELATTAVQELMQLPSARRAAALKALAAAIDPPAQMIEAAE